MLIAYSLSEHGPRTIAAHDGEAMPDDASWVDLNQPTREEDLAAEAFLKASLPTREEAQEIEFSSRFYTEDGAVFMTAVGADRRRYQQAGARALHHRRRRRQPHCDAPLRGTPRLQAVPRPRHQAGQRLRDARRRCSSA